MGPVTGTSYRFSGLDQVQLVDPRDAFTIVRSTAFRIEGVIELATTGQSRDASGASSDA
jgi:hypothetical protein